jgi:tetratricopeptide (TPR) repeat protein
MSVSDGTDRLPRWAHWALPLVLFACVFAAFSPALSADFVNFDDEANITENKRFRGLSQRHLEWMWTVPHSGPYMPLTWMTLAVDHELWGLGDGLAAPEAPRYHATNVLLHALAALAAYVLALRLLARAAPGLGATARALGAALSSFLFAVHPLRVESVAWVTERRDVLSGVLFLLAVSAYVKAAPRGAPELRPGAALGVLGATVLAVAALALSVEMGDEALAFRGAGAAGLAAGVALLGLATFLIPRASWYPAQRGRSVALVVSMVWLALAFLSKALGVMLPLVLLLVDTWPLRRWSRADGRRAITALVVEKLPYLALSLVFGVLAVWGQSRYSEALVLLERHGLGERVVQSFYGLWFYVTRTLAPHGLIPLVELPQTMGLTEARFLIPALAVLVVAAGAVWSRRRAPAPLVALTALALLVAPVLGLSQTGGQLVADRYSYLPTLSLALLLGGGWALWYQRSARAPALAAALIAAALLGTLTWRQTRHWRTSAALWTHMAAVAPASGLPHMLLGMLRYREGQEAQDAERPRLFEESRQHFEEGMRRDPDPVFLYLIGYSALLIDSGHLEDSLPVLAQLLQKSPDDPTGLTNLGMTLRTLGRPLESLAPLERCVQVDPTNPKAWLQLGLTYESLDRKPRAIQCFERVLELWPKYRPAKRKLAELQADN